MIEVYNLNAICFLRHELITLQDAIKKEKYIRYFEPLDENTIGYIRIDGFYECSFVPVNFGGMYLRRKVEEER